MGKKKTKNYDSERFKNLISHIEKNSKFRVNVEELKKAIKCLPKELREMLEKYWGLTGGIDHSKKSENYDKKDVAYVNMLNGSKEAVRELLKIEYMISYADGFSELLNEVIRKIDKKGIRISDWDAVRYVIAFFIFMVNGPKMSYEDDPLVIKILPRAKGKEDNWFYEHEMIIELSRLFKPLMDKSINLKILMNFFDMINYKDALTIKKSMRIQVSDSSELQDIKMLRTDYEIRDFKEELFPRGAWNVTNALIMGNFDVLIELDEFKTELERICKDWSKVYEYKSSQEKVKVLRNLRILDVYHIGGIEITDLNELDFLYLIRNLIWN